MTLPEFLLARIVEDETSARDATRGPWVECADSPAAAVYSPTDDTYVTDPHNWNAVGSDARHIARHDPARVLAECASKRQVVEMLDSGGNWHDYGGNEWFILCALALPYADHPDYDPEWKP